jgi:hypothetical protein
MVDKKQNDNVMDLRKALAGELFALKVDLQSVEIAVVHALASVEGARQRPVPLAEDLEWIDKALDEIAQWVDSLAVSRDRTVERYLAHHAALSEDKDSERRQ